MDPVEVAEKRHQRVFWQIHIARLLHKARPEQIPGDWRKPHCRRWKCECSAKFQSKQEIINHIRRVHPDKVIDSFDLHAYENAIVFDAKLSKIVRHEIVMVNQAELSEDIEDKGEKLVLETPILWGDIEEDDTDPLSDSKCKAEVTDNPEFEDPLRIF